MSFRSFFFLTVVWESLVAAGMAAATFLPPNGTDMSENENTPLPQVPADPLVLIAKAGKLNYTIEQAVAIVCSSFPEQDKDALLKQISTEGTKEHSAYHNGKIIKLFAVENALYDAATDGDVDAQEALLKLQVDKDVARAIKEKFFPDETDTECE